MILSYHDADFEFSSQPRSGLRGKKLAQKMLMRA